jgi:hypothetical protein
MCPHSTLNNPKRQSKPFLTLLKKLEEINLIAFLRRIDGKLVLKIFPKPPAKQSNILINWLFFLATIGTTFTTGYRISISGGFINPIIGGATFMATINDCFRRT